MPGEVKTLNLHDVSKLYLTFLNIISNTWGFVQETALRYSTVSLWQIY